jgi:ABC-type polysaccharide/polyol phosphate export permease
LKVIFDSKRKGDRLIINHSQLQKYLEEKLHDLSNFLSNAITALIILSVMVVIQTFKASDIYLYALILLPLIGRGFIHTRILANLKKRFEELLAL